MGTLGPKYLIYGYLDPLGYIVTNMVSEYGNLI